MNERSPPGLSGRSWGSGETAMGAMRVATVVLVGALALAGCGRKSLPVPPVAEGQTPGPAVIAPGADGLAAAPRVAGGTTVAPAEISANPNAPERPFILDRLLN